SAAAFGVMIAPLAVFALRTGGQPLSWVEPLQQDFLTVLSIDFSGVYGWKLLSLDVAALGIAALAAFGGRNNEERVAWGYSLFASWLVVLVAMVGSVSLLRPVFVPRFVSFCLPAFLLLVSAGLVRLRPAMLCWSLLAAIAACSILADFNYY